MKRIQRVTLQTTSAGATEAFAAVVGERLPDGALISLTGPLGAGKSVIARGICRGLGVDEGVLSPTFILFEEYPGRCPVIHCDLYRLEHEQDIEDLGVFDRIGDGSVIVIEWGDRSERLTDLADIVIALEMTSENDRTITVACSDELASCFEGMN